MKIRFYKLISRLLFILVLTTLPFQGCKRKMFKKITYSGHAIDHATGKPLVGIKIELNACGGGPADKSMYGCQGSQFNIGSATTDSDGYFSITGKAAHSDIYYVYIDYNGARYGAFADGASGSKLRSDYSVIYLYH